MPDPDGTAFALAAALHSLSDERLGEVIARRDFRSSGVTDFLVLAERLTDHASVQAALAPLERRTLLALAVVGESAGRPMSVQAIADRLSEIDQPESFAFPTGLEERLDELVERALVIESPEGYLALESVRDVMAAWPAQGLPDLKALARPIPEFFDDAEPADAASVESACAERALTTPLALVELVDELAREGAHELARGGIGSPDLKRLAAAAHIDVAHVPTLIRLGRDAGLIGFHDDSWRPRADAAEWELLPLPERWARLAEGWLSSIPADLRHVLADRGHVVWGPHNQEFLDWAFPAAGERARAGQERLVAAGELLGVLHERVPGSAGTALIAGGADAALVAVRLVLPAVVEHVYVQQDLSVIAPGPLAPAIDARLRTIADVETRAVASTFRITPGSIERSLRAGESEAGLLAFLESVATGPLPQPLRYLIAEVAARFGIMRVGTITSGPSVPRVSYVRSSDPVLLETTLVDRRLSPLGLTREEDGRLTSRFPRDVLYLALADAHYPVVAEDADGSVVGVARHHVGRQLAPHPPAAWERVDIARLVQTLRASQDAVEGITWIERQLELAVRSRLRVRLTVRMPGGDEEQFVVEPTGVANGRLRARDRKADIERTLPLSRIIEVSEASEH